MSTNPPDNYREACLWRRVRQWVGWKSSSLNVNIVTNLILNTTSPLSLIWSLSRLVFVAETHRRGAPGTRLTSVSRWERRPSSSSSSWWTLTSSLSPTLDSRPEPPVTDTRLQQNRKGFMILSPFSFVQNLRNKKYTSSLCLFQHPVKLLMLTNCIYGDK